MAKKEVKNLPKIFLGSSPFIGAGQFGFKSLIYYQHFYLKPENILKIIRRSWEFGVKGFNLLAYKPLIEATRKALEEGLDLTILGTVEPKNFEFNVRLLEKIGVVGILVHAEITDNPNQKIVEDCFRFIRKTGRLTGFATHEPFKTLNRIQKLNLDYDIVMVPLNITGTFMDSKPEELIKILKGLRERGKFIIAKKVLAAGNLKPKEALEYVAKTGCVDAVVVGIASEEEIVETFTYAKRFFG